MSVDAHVRFVLQGRDIYVTRVTHTLGIQNPGVRSQNTIHTLKMKENASQALWSKEFDDRRGKNIMLSKSIHEFDEYFSFGHYRLPIPSEFWILAPEFLLLRKSCL